MPRATISVYDLEPLEAGGAVARQGFSFQDHVATSLCLELFENPELAEVWCETHDDITLIWKSDPNSTVAEFVQVKSNKLNQLWSLSKLYAAENGQSSILEKSLAQDRCSEAAVFRLTTAIPFNAELSVLMLPRLCAERAAQAQVIKELAEKLPAKLKNARSENGASCHDWLQRALLECRDSEEAVKSHGMLMLGKILEDRGTPALQGQLYEVYARLVSRVSDASKLDPKSPNKQDKRFTKDKIASVLGQIVETLFGIPTPSGGTRLQEKMTHAGIAADSILQAQEQRRFFRTRSLKPKYLELGEGPNLDEEVQAMLMHLRAQIDSGELPDDGPKFHKICLDRLAAYRESVSKRKRPSLADLQGAMYNITDRCLHRFRRAGA